MAFSFPWYDLLCFALLATALAASLSSILAGDRSCKAQATSMYRRLLSAGEDGGGGGSGSGETDEVLGCELWMSRWRPVHPVALLGARLVAAAAMFKVFIWDLRTYDWSIIYLEQRGCFSYFINKIVSFLLYPLITSTLLFTSRINSSPPVAPLAYIQKCLLPFLKRGFPIQDDSLDVR